MGNKQEFIQAREKEHAKDCTQLKMVVKTLRACLVNSLLFSPFLSFFYFSRCQYYECVGLA